MSNISGSDPLPLWTSKWWLWGPPLPLLLELALRAAGKRAEAEAFFGGELGFTELSTVVLLIPAIVFAARSAWAAKPWLLRGWFALLALGCLYFAGEEASWGQHLAQWQTPAAIAAVNDQAETNFHNMSSWLDQKPRLLLELWIVIGGLGVAVARSARGQSFQPEVMRSWVWPWAEVIPSSLLVFIVRWPERIASWKDEPPPLIFSYRLSESQELYFACFLLIFTWASWRRFRQSQPAQISRLY